MAPAVRSRLKKRIETVAGRSIESLSSKAIAAHAPGTRFLETKGLGHRRILHSSSVAEAVVSFLKGPPSQAVIDV